MKKAILLVVLWTGLGSISFSQAGEWKVVESDSFIGFIATYDDIPFEARFESFEADIEFAAGDLDSASFDVSIETVSLDSNSPDRDSGMQEQEWFATEKHPAARFRTDRIERISDNRYRAIGELTVKDVTRTIEVPFTWEQESGDQAILIAETRLKRGDFNIGTGEWAEDDIIGFDVVVKARLTLARR